MRNSAALRGRERNLKPDILETPTAAFNKAGFNSQKTGQVETCSCGGMLYSRTCVTRTLAGGRVMRVDGIVGACTADAFAACTGHCPKLGVQAAQNTRRPICITLMLAAFLLVLTPGSSRAGCKASSPCVTSPLDLGTLGGTSSTSSINSEATAVSGNGNIVVGSSLTGDPVNIGSHAFLWQSGVMIDLGTLGGSGPHDGSSGLDVSDNGQVVVGVANTADGDGHAFRWKASTGMVDLGTLGGSGSAAWGVNDNGSVIVGQSDTRFTRTARLHLEGFRRNGRFGHAWRRWWLCGPGCQQQRRRGGWLVRARYRPKGARLSLDSSRHDRPRSTKPGEFRSQAHAVDSKGSTVVGWTQVLNGYQHAFRWTSGAGMTDLGSLSGPNDNSQAYDVSGDGSVVVGWSGTPTTGAPALPLDG